MRSTNSLIYVPLDNALYIRPFYSNYQPELQDEPCTCKDTSGQNK